MRPPPDTLLTAATNCFVVPSTSARILGFIAKKMLLPVWPPTLHVPTEQREVDARGLSPDHNWQLNKSPLASKADDLFFWQERRKHSEFEREKRVDYENHLRLTREKQEAKWDGRKGECSKEQGN